MAVVRWTPQALQDINDIAVYLEKDSVRYASLFVERVFGKAELISVSIRMGRVVPEFNENSIRELIFERYRIIYRVVTEDRADVLSVFHGSRILSKESLFE